MRFWLGKLIGFLAGMLLGTGIILVPAVIYQVMNPNEWAGEVRTLGPRMGFMYDLLGTTAVSLLIGLLFGIIGQAYGGWRQEVASQRNAQLAAAKQAQQARNVWPPPPIKGDTDNT